MRKAATAALVIILAAVPAACSGDGDGGNHVGLRGAGSFEFAVIGDFPYTPTQLPMFNRLIDDINGEQLALTLHIGDIGNKPCSDADLGNTRAAFDRFAAPLVYTPGDNEWTDCHQSGVDPLARLARVRQDFFATPRSFGGQTLDLLRQTPDYPENSRFSVEEVTFVGVHQVGSNDGAGRTPEGDAEHQARSEANQAWLRAGFEAATAAGSHGVVVFMHANPDLERYAVNVDTGHTAVLRAVEREVLAFHRPVLLVHGDTHTFQVDKPLFGPDRLRIENFTRMETFGSPDVHWARVMVDPGRPELFSFTPEIVGANVVDHGPTR